jgi:hypothetical protein
MANQGIMHIATTRGGKPICGKRNAHMSTTREHFASDGWTRMCVKCAEVIAKWEAKEAKK